MLKATILKMPSGIEFIAFFDYDRLITSEDEAQSFLASMRMITQAPLTISFRIGENWFSIGTQDDCSDFIVSHLLDFENRAALLLSEPVLIVPRKPGE
jgi:hypothetical protein